MYAKDKDNLKRQFFFFGKTALSSVSGLGTARKCGSYVQGDAGGKSNF